MSRAMRATRRVRYGHAQSAVLPAPPASPWRGRACRRRLRPAAEPSWREIDWLSLLHRVEIDGRQVNYVELGSGEGPPIVFVHGLGGQWQNWLENIPRFAQERRVVALDLPGLRAVGDAAREDHDPRLRPLPSTSSPTGSSWGRVDLVGNSMGGFVAAEVAVQSPERVNRLVLVSAAGITSADSEALARPRGSPRGRRARHLHGGALPADRRAADHAPHGAGPGGAPPVAGSRPTSSTRGS